MRRFVEATNIGYYNYLYGDRKAADALIQKINPDISDDYIEKSIPILRAHIDVGDAPTKGIGAMSDERMKDFYDKTVAAGLYKPATSTTTTRTRSVRQQGHRPGRRKEAGEVARNEDVGTHPDRPGGGAHPRQTPEILSFELAHPAGRPLPGYQAGAHIDVQMPGGFSRQYSLDARQRRRTSAPTDRREARDRRAAAARPRCTCAFARATC